MRIDCESCNAAFTIDDSLITDRGIRAQCPKCGTQRVVKPNASAESNPFGGASAPSGGGANPFGPSGAANPFGSPAPAPSASPSASSMGNPFGAGPSAGLFAPPPAPSGANPFANAGPAANPFGGSPASTANPFAAATTNNPFPSPGSGANPNPFPSPGSGASPNPFSGGASPASNPFGAAPASNPFGGASSPSASANPFGAPQAPVNPFGGAPAATNPFGAAPAPANPFGASPAPAASPFGGNAPASNPFGTASPASSPFGNGPTPGTAPMSADPFGGASMSGGDAGDAFGNFGGGSPNSGGTGGGIGGSDLDFDRPPGADAGRLGDADDPFSDIAGAAAAPSSNKSTSMWRVEARGGNSENLSLDEVREMIRAGQVGPNDMAGPMGKPLSRVSDSSVLSISLPKGASKKGPYGVSAGASSMGKMTLFLLLAIVVGGLGFGVYTVRPDLFERTTDEGVNPFRRALTQWSMQFPDVQGTSQEHVVEGKKFMRQDTVVGYRRADEHFRRALLIDVSNRDAIAAYVENYANLPNVSARSDADGVALAFEGLEYALSKDRQNPSLLRAQGALRLALGEVDEAQKHLVQAQRISPDDVETKLLLARSQLDRDTAEALKLIEMVQRQDPGLKASLVVAGAANRRVGHFNRSRQFIDSRLESDPGNVPALRELARLEVSLGNGQAAVGALRRLLDAEEGDVDARLMLGKVQYQLLNRKDDAERELKIIVDNHEAAAGELLLPTLAHLAYLRVLKGDTDAGIELSERALKLDPSYAPASLVLGRAKATKGDLEGAKASLETAVRALAASPSHAFYEPLARSMLADVQTRMGDTANAIRNFNQVIDYDPSFARPFFGLAATHMIADQPRQAVTVMRRALDIDPAMANESRSLTDFPTPSYDLLVYADAFKAARPGTAGQSIKDAAEGVIRVYAGQDGEARALFRKSLASDKENLSALAMLAYFDIEDRKYADAVAKLRRATRSTGATHGISHYYLARGELALGQTAEASKRLQELIDTEKSMSQAKYWLGMTKLKQGKRDEAMALFRLVLKEAPEFVPVKKTLVELESD